MAETQLGQRVTEGDGGLRKALRGVRLEDLDASDKTICIIRQKRWNHWLFGDSGIWRALRGARRCPRNCVAVDGIDGGMADEEFEGLRLLRAEQVAGLIGVSPATLKKWRLERREIPYVKIGQAVRYRPADVHAWIEKNMRGVC